MHIFIKFSCVGFVISRMNSDRFDDVSPLPVDVRLTKGSVHVVASRAFVDYAIRNETAVKFRDWCEGLLFPDETYFSSLNHSPNLGVPGAYLGRHFCQVFSA